MLLKQLRNDCHQTRNADTLLLSLSLVRGGGNLIPLKHNLHIISALDSKVGERRKKNTRCDGGGGFPDKLLVFPPLTAILVSLLP